MRTKKILLILTGGTVCSFANEQGEQASDTKKAQALIVDHFRKGNSRYSSEDCVRFTSVSPLNVLSENMTVAHWDVLIGALRTYDYSQYDGVILLHGTDTLAYTASLLSLLLAGLPIPVLLVSSQLPLSNPQANGNRNFQAAVELIANGIQPNVYAVYENEEITRGTPSRVMYVHFGAHLLQCANRSNNFYSCDMTAVDTQNASFKGIAAKKATPLLFDDRLKALNARILKIQPYVGLDYSTLSIDGIDAVIHGTYHSSTVATDTDLPTKDGRCSSVLHFAARCRNHTPPIPLFLEPYEKTTYETTGDALRNGILPIENLTSETAYVKALVGCSLGLSQEELYDFINSDVNRERLPPC
ncbi:MAG: hypothetical protein E7637_02370 [Ruminococcaceae bacterium]|nr:hypothetical protein [Oscillospiraceae bacterium]